MNPEKKVVQSLLKSRVQEHNTTVQFQDVWVKYKNNKEQPSKLKIPKAGLVACACLLIATPVGASFLTNWYNIDLVKNETPQPADTTPWLKYENYPDYLGTYKQVSLEESEKLAPFKVLRPVNFAMPIELSTGVLRESGEFYSYWDLFHDGDKWAYAKQELDSRSKQMLNEEEMKIQFMLPQNAEVIPLQDKDVLAIMDDLGEGGKRITMLVKTDSEHVTSFEMRGNIGSEEMITLAKAYSEN